MNAERLFLMQSLALKRLYHHADQDRCATSFGIHNNLVFDKGRQCIKGYRQHWGVPFPFKVGNN